MKNMTLVPAPSMSSFRLRIFALLLWLGSAAASADTITIGIVTDGPNARLSLSPDYLLAEANSILVDSPRLVMPADKQLDGGWTLAGMQNALDRLLADPQVDMVLTLGLLSSNLAAHRSQLAKPVVAPFVADPVLQGYPLQDGHSGRRNFAYVASFHSIADEVRTFHRVTGFKHLAVLIDQLTLEALPELRRKAEQQAAELNVRITLVPAADSVDQAMAALPTDADGVYVTPLPRLSETALQRLAAALAERRLPSFSLFGRTEVEAGILMTTAGSEADMQRLARRIALNVQRIQAGEDPGQLEVGYPAQQRLVINMRTARAIGFSPRWQDLSDAEQLHAEETGNAEQLSLLAAMQAALDSNPSLAASRTGVDLAEDDLRNAQAALLPRLDASAQAARIDADRANPLFQSEKTASAGLNLRQLIYSDRSWAGRAIAERFKTAADEQYRQAMLDTLQSAATAYLNLLRARSVEAVRRSNVEYTRSNLETSRIREAVGLGGRSDYLRWITQISRDRQNLLAAEAARRQAENELARLLHRPADAHFTTVETGLAEPMALISSPRTQSYIDTPVKWSVFQEFSVAEALSRSPELKRFDALISGQERAVKSAQRAFFLPEFSLQANGSNAFERSGAGSQFVPGAPDAESWSVTLQATLPLFTGGARSAEHAHERHELRQLLAQRLATADLIEARTRSALHSTASSFPAIDLSQQAANAARENMTMVRDAYGRGIVSVTELIDAQEAGLSAELAEAEAKYAFLIDFVAVLRATGSFDMLLDPASSQAWYERVEAWYRAHSADTRRP